MTFWSILRESHAAFLAGLSTTVRLCLIVWFTSLFLGSGLGIAASRSWIMRAGLGGVSALFAGVPALVVLFWLYYPGQAILGVDVSPFSTAALALSMIGIVFVAESILRSIEEVPSQYALAGAVAGLSRQDVLRYVTVPLILNSFVPRLLVTFVSLFQMTFFAAFISVDELFRAAQRVNAIVYRPVEIYTALALFCMAVSLPLYATAAWLRKRTRNMLSEL